MSDNLKEGKKKAEELLSSGSLRLLFATVSFVAVGNMNAKFAHSVPNTHTAREYMACYVS